MNVRKSVFQLLCTLVLMCVFTACEDAKVYRDISGRTFMGQDGTGMVSVYFAKNHDCTLTSYDALEGTSLVVPCLEYKITGRTIEIKYDNSSYWQSAARGKVFQSMSYDPDKDLLNWMGITLYPID
ncbi:MAG: hypothetical protein J6Y77_02565 [Paludibacteraceae bacterium]|nr:hypothetical protein [Paludibacteraceae bacterium]